MFASDVASCMCISQGFAGTRGHSGGWAASEAVGFSGIDGSSSRERAAVFFLSFVWLLPLIAPQHVPPLPAGGSGPSAGSASGRGPLQQEGNVTDACARGRMMRFKFNASEKKKKERLEKPVNHSKGKLFSKSQRTSFKIMC